MTYFNKQRFHSYWPVSVLQWVFFLELWVCHVGTILGLLRPYIFTSYLCFQMKSIAANLIVIHIREVLECLSRCLTTCELFAYGVLGQAYISTYWSLNKLIFSNAFLRMKTFEVLNKYHWNMFLDIHLASQHRFVFMDTTSDTIFRH